MNANEGATFAQHLRQLREAAGLSQEELAERSGLSRDAISALERGKRQYPHPATLRMLADGLRLDDAELQTLKILSRRNSATPLREETRTAISPDDLPMPLTSLIGREAELAEILHLIANGARLITLTGPGGVGKTRLALEIGKVLRDVQPVAFVSLAPVRDPALVLPSILQACGLRDHGESSLPEQLAQAIGSHRLVVIIDNLEHLEPAYTDISRVHERCPQVVFLITSRASLRVRAEVTVPIEPLGADESGSGANSTASPAVALFVARAQASRPDFQRTDENAATIRELCARLDGLPLAIELAAARIKVLSPTAILNRIDRRFDLLTGGPRDSDPRLQSLRSALGWSFDLLDPLEQDLFCVLSAFAESFALDDAEAIVTQVFPDFLHSDILGHVASLVDKSLVASEPDEQREARFSMLQSVREYGRERLNERGLAASVRSAHAQCFLALAERAFLGFRTRHDHEWWLDSLERDRNNIRQALEWFAEHGDGVALARLAGALYWFWDIRGPLSEGRAWLERALARSAGDVPRDVHFQVLLAAGQLAHFQGDDEQAQIWSAELYAAMPDSTDPWMRATPLMLLGLIAEDRGEYAIAEDRFSAALTLFNEAEDEYNSALAVHHLGVTAWGQGDSERATALCTAALADQRKLNDTWHIANSYGYLGLIAITDRRPVDAAFNLLECMEIRWRSNAREDIASSIADFAALAAMIDQPELAVRLFGAAAASRRQVGRVVINLPERTLFETAEARTRTALTPDEHARQAAAGAAMSLGEAVEGARRFAAEIIGSASS